MVDSTAFGITDTMFGFVDARSTVFSLLYSKTKRLANH